MSSEMRECPFCGATEPTHHIILLHSSNPEVTPDSGVYGYCITCGTSGPEADTEAAAIAAWNQRAGDDEMIAALTRLRAEVTELTAKMCAELDQKDAELASLRQEKNEAIGAALQVEQKCYDQAQELAALRDRIEVAQGIIKEPYRDYLTETEWNESKLERLAQAIWGEPVQDDLEANDD